MLGNIENIDISKLYTEYCRPQVGSLLKSLRLDKVFHKAVENKIFYLNENEEEIEVLDCLGGYGSLLFGHNYPEFIEIIKSKLESLTPFSAQASCRSGTALAAKQINNMLYSRFQTEYITTFVNSGTEAVECALKHAELYRKNKNSKRLVDFEERRIKIQSLVQNGNYKYSEQFFKFAKKKFEIKIDEINPKDIFKLMFDFNKRTFDKAPFFLSLKNAFHGKTLGSLQLTYNEKFKFPVNTIGPKVIFVDPICFDSVTNDLTELFFDVVIEKNEVVIVEKNFKNISAIFIEPLQGEGGIHSIDKAFFHRCRKFTKANDIPLVLDEIQCGMGRTGSFLYSEQLEVQGDYYLLGKSLGGGISKISAFVVNKQLYELDFGILHSSTFSEDEISSLIAYKALSLLEENSEIMENCLEKGNLLLSSLKKLKEKYPLVIEDIRGAGLMIGIQFKKPEKVHSRLLRLLSEQNYLGPVISAYLLHEHRIRIAPTMSDHLTIRIEPSAFITFEECDRITNSLEKLCETLDKHNMYELLKFLVYKEDFISEKQIQDFKKFKIEKEKVNHNKKVGFVFHLIESHHLALQDESLGLFEKEEMGTLINCLYQNFDPVVYQEEFIHSVNGEIVQIIFIGIMMSSDIIAQSMLQRRSEFICDSIEKATKIAIQNGCTVVGFGGLTSVASNNCKNIMNDSIALTTGNSFTVAMGLEGIYEAAKIQNINLSNSTFAVVGANGNIGSVYSEIIAESVPKIILIGREGREKSLVTLASSLYENAIRQILNFLYEVEFKPDLKLSGLAKSIYDTESVKEFLERYFLLNEDNFEDCLLGSGELLFQSLINELGSKAPIIISTDLFSLKEANIILSASSFPKPIIFSEHLGNGPIVICDVAIPPDVDSSVENERHDVSIILGGVVKFPLNPDFEILGMPLPKGHGFACMSETMLLGLNGTTESFSIGKITKQQVKEIASIAKQHNFTLGFLKKQKSM
ncbi:aminotransferase class III-fold pyridoxal phosphate-dependent enzyme [Leptospira santarosai]|uniref:aminotransferase class III-fold pyridoxal phosphate-dependent enzyme n=1 Tax=Leptospira santarosai TaxID=28183 RepID=UPI0002BD9A49|nr:aminotransferase class III-fold pyridoxal phosphate-dependent enzyme [Leptospira santarosai]EMO73399.1 aminotransferase, class III [Leptospira santarosai str. 200403458]EMO98225.1 aminotransferase, class III [Leptospira santarosai str. 200702252]